MKNLVILNMIYVCVPFCGPFLVEFSKVVEGTQYLKNLRGT